jgi:glycosyltransferase involved in cell wall biosynthesis
MPKISIIVPVYNVEQYINRCINSLLGQTLKDIEIILVDDGSPDRCPQICDEYARKDSRIKVIHKKNGGLGYARNSGLELATGEYIAFVDSDDYVNINMYEKLYNETINNNFDIVYCGFIVENKDKSTYEENKRDRILQTRNDILNLCRNMIACDAQIKTERSESMAVWHGIYKNQLIRSNNIKFESERNILSEDIVFDLQLIPLCTTIRSISDALYIHCYNNESLSKTFNPTKINRNVSLFNKLLSIAANYNLESYKFNIMRLFIGYNRSFLKQIILSKNSFQNKKELCNQIFNLEIWNNIISNYPIKSLPYFQQIVIKFIKNHNFLLVYIFFTILKRLKKI